MKSFLVQWQWDFRHLLLSDPHKPEHWHLPLHVLKNRTSWLGCRSLSYWEITTQGSCGTLVMMCLHADNPPFATINQSISARYPLFLSFYMWRKISLLLFACILAVCEYLSFLCPDDINHYDDATVFRGCHGWLLANQIMHKPCILLFYWLTTIYCQLVCSFPHLQVEEFPIFCHITLSSSHYGFAATASCTPSCHFS